MPNLDRITPGTGQTTDGATPITVGSFDTSGLGAARSIHVECVFIGRSAAGATCTARRSASFKRVSGTLSLLGSVGSVFSQVTDLAAVAMTLDANGNTIRARATGVNATSINWTTYFEVWTD